MFSTISTILRLDGKVIAVLKQQGDDTSAIWSELNSSCKWEQLGYHFFKNAVLKTLSPHTPAFWMCLGVCVLPDMPIDCQGRKGSISLELWLFANLGAVAGKLIYASPMWLCVWHRLFKSLDPTRKLISLMLSCLLCVILAHMTLLSLSSFLFCP